MMARACALSHDKRCPVEKSRRKTTHKKGEEKQLQFISGCAKAREIMELDSSCNW
jgi:hypothetical protein